jgi:glutamine amidotransferase
MITIIDYGAGNIKSIKNMLKKIGVRSQISSNKEIIENAEKLILPGVGHFDYGMKNLEASGLINTLNQKVLIDKVPLLGICLGAQLLGNRSDEGERKGLGWIDMDILKFLPEELPVELKIPHMGWNYTEKTKESKLLIGVEQFSRYYFVHIYYMKAHNTEDILLKTNYGIDFVSAVEKGNIYGVQFHPEKSHRYGMELLRNFANRI